MTHDDDSLSALGAAENAALAQELERLRASEEQLRTEYERLLDTQWQLEQSRDEYLERFELGPLPALTVTAAGVIHDANLAAVALLGQQRQQLLQHVLGVFVAPEDRGKLALHLASSQRSAGPVITNVRLLLPDVPPFPVKLQSQLCSRSQGLVQTTIVDLRERERDLDERRRLVEAERRAREEIEAKDKFIAMLSHELRTPLTPVLAGASAYEDREDLSPELRRVFGMIRRNVAAEARLIDDLLDLTGIVRGKMKVEKQPLDVHREVLEVVEALKDEAQSKQLYVEVELSAAQHHVGGDPLRLRQVFWNLLRNALKFTPRDGEIHLRSWNNHDGIAIEVADSGIGINPATMNRLFEPFDQLQEHKPSSGGLGLGLTISKGLVELHGGQISASSPGIGRGSRFVVELQTIAAPEQVEGEKRPQRVSSAPPSPARRILLVEDHEDTAEMMIQLLRAAGYQVSPAASMKEALQADLDSVDLIVSDLGLPDGTGIDLIKELQAGGHKPAIALSGYGMESDVQKSKNAGFDLHLTKPIDLDRLLQAIRKLSKLHPQPPGQ